MKVRIGWIRCYDCGRNGVDGGCFITQYRSWFGWWRALVTDYDRDGATMVKHFQTLFAAKVAISEHFGRKQDDFRVVEEIER